MYLKKNNPVSCEKLNSLKLWCSRMNLYVCIITSIFKAHDLIDNEYGN